MNVGIRLARFGIWAGVGGKLMSGTQNLLILYLGASAVIAGEMTLGMLFAFQSYRSSFAGSVMGLIDTFMSWKMVGLHLERLADIVHTEAEESQEKVAQLPRSLSGRIEVQNLRFRYGDNEPWVLDGTNLEISPGDRVAIVGRSGGGKSTLMKLMLGLYRPHDGQVLFDGKSIENWGRRRYAPKWAW